MDYQSKKETYTIRSSISPQLIGRTLKKGGFIAAAGAFLIILGGTFLPINQLKIWGIPIFLVGMVLIAIGFLPFKKLYRVQCKPHELSYDGESFIFLERGKPLFKIPEASIQKIAYLEKNNLYGLAIWLKHPIVEKVRVLQPHFDIEAFTRDSATRFEGCDLFLPYFTQRSWQNMESVYQEGLR
ncbi:MAG: hypothetical protein WAM28_02660 [Chlamydiales bacterium]